MYIVIDRIEKDIAVCIADDESVVKIPIKILPYDAKEGSVLKIVADKEEKKKRTDRISALFDRLKNKD